MRRRRPGLPAGALRSVALRCRRSEGRRRRAERLRPGRAASGGLGASLHRDEACGRQPAVEGVPAQPLPRVADCPAVRIVLLRCVADWLSLDGKAACMHVVRVSEPIVSPHRAGLRRRVRRRLIRAPRRRLEAGDVLRRPLRVALHKRRRVPRRPCLMLAGMRGHMRRVALRLPVQRQLHVRLPVPLLPIAHVLSLQIPGVQNCWLANGWLLMCEHWPLRRWHIALRGAVGLRSVAVDLKAPRMPSAHGLQRSLLRPVPKLLQSRRIVVPRIRRPVLGGWRQLCGPQ